MNENNQFWLVGAAIGGRNATKKFLERGYWELSRDLKPKRNTLYMERFRKMQPGDRIAIKSISGKGSAMMKIQCIGIVKEIDSEERRAYVSWLGISINRVVDWNGCMDAINGPYMLDSKQTPWLNAIFRI